MSDRPLTEYHGDSVLCREGRTGIQLKDKWRNLVKYCRLSTEELNRGAAGAARVSDRQCAPTKMLSFPPHLCAHLICAAQMCCVVAITGTCRGCPLRRAEAELGPACVGTPQQNASQYFAAPADHHLLDNIYHFNHNGWLRSQLCDWSWDILELCDVKLRSILFGCVHHVRGLQTLQINKFVL